MNREITVRVMVLVEGLCVVNKAPGRVSCS